VLLKQLLDEQEGPTENEHCTTDDFEEAQYDSEDVKPMNVVYADSASDSHKGIYTNTSLYAFTSTYFL